MISMCAAPQRPEFDRRVLFFVWETLFHSTLERLLCRLFHNPNWISADSRNLLHLILNLGSLCLVLMAAWMGPMSSQCGFMWVWNYSNFKLYFSIGILNLAQHQTEPIKWTSWKHKNTTLLWFFLILGTCFNNVRHTAYYKVWYILSASNS